MVPASSGLQAGLNPTPTRAVCLNSRAAMAAIKEKDSRSTLKLGTSRIVKELLKAAWHRITGPHRRCVKRFRSKKKSRGDGDQQWCFATAHAQALPRAFVIVDPPINNAAPDVHVVDVVRARPEEHVGSDAKSEVALLERMSGVEAVDEHLFQGLAPSSELARTLSVTSRPKPRSKRSSSGQNETALQCTTCEHECPEEERFPSVPQACAETHEAETCLTCWQQWLEVQVGSQSYDQISCVQCSNKLNQLDIKRLATTAIFEQYLDAEAKSALATDDSFTWCLAPKCSSGQLHYGNEHFTCAQCGHEHCINCRVDWHAGETCRAYTRKQNEHAKTKKESKLLHARLRQEEASTAAMIDDETKLCPGKKCGRRVVKIR